MWFKDNKLVFLLKHRMLRVGEDINDKQISDC